jgi:hypothetical protein
MTTRGWQDQSANTPEKKRNLQKARSRLPTAGMIQVYTYNFGTRKQQETPGHQGPYTIVVRQPADGSEPSLEDVVDTIEHNTTIQEATSVMGLLPRNDSNSLILGYVYEGGYASNKLANDDLGDLPVQLLKNWDSEAKVPRAQVCIYPNYTSAGMEQTMSPQDIRRAMERKAVRAEKQAREARAVEAAGHRAAAVRAVPRTARRLDVKTLKREANPLRARGASVPSSPPKRARASPTPVTPVTQQGDEDSGGDSQDEPDEEYRARMMDEDEEL